MVTSRDVLIEAIFLENKKERYKVKVEIKKWKRRIPKTSRAQIKCHDVMGNFIYTMISTVFTHT